MQSGRDDLMDKVKEEVISEGPETQGGECFTGLTVECPVLTVSPWIGCGEPFFIENVPCWVPGFQLIQFCSSVLLIVIR